MEARDSGKLIKRYIAKCNPLFLYMDTCLMHPLAWSLGQPLSFLNDRPSSGSNFEQFSRQVFKCNFRNDENTTNSIKPWGRQIRGGDQRLVVRQLPAPPHMMNVILLVDMLCSDKYVQDLQVRLLGDMKSVEFGEVTASCSLRKANYVIIKFKIASYFIIQTDKTCKSPLWKQSTYTQCSLTE